MQLPPGLRQEWARDADWLAELPELVRACAVRWQLDLEEPFATPRSLVVPAGESVLKLNAPTHYEADHEAAALACWAGHGAVKLLARDDGKRAFLIERCRPGTRLSDSRGDGRSVVAELLSRSWTAPGPRHPFRTVAGEAERWAEELAHAYEQDGRPFERSLLALSLHVLRSSDPTAGTLVNQDLHGGNILRAQREPWLVIDPKPAIGEREVSGVGLLRNAAWKGGSAEVGRWLTALAALGLDRERLRGWGVAHALAWGRDRDGSWSPRALAAARAIFAA